MMVSDANGIILRVSETYEKNFGFAHDSIVGKSAFDLEKDGTFTPCITAEVIRRRKKISATQTINHTHKNVMTVGIPLFDANGELKYAVCFNTVSMEQINSIQRNYRRMQDSLQHYSQEIAELRTRATSTNLLFKSAPMQRLWTLMQNTCLLYTSAPARSIAAVARELVPSARTWRLGHFFFTASTRPRPLPPPWPSTTATSSSPRIILSIPPFSDLPCSLSLIHI